MHNERISQVEWAPLEGTRPRPAGSNARLGEHGLTVHPAFARITTESGVSGFGFSRATPNQAERLLGLPLSTLFSARTGTLTPGLPVDFALWDLAGQLANQPAYRLAAATRDLTVIKPMAVACYDTSLYIDDLHLSSENEAAALIAAEAKDGYMRGHRSFKIKVGRGARHLPLAEGTQRDIAVIHAVRDAVGDEATIMLDANNGYNLNLAKQVLAETATCRIHWMEEPFHEDRVLNQDLKDWLQAVGLETLVADGEGEASPSLLEWAEDGLIDVVQYDIFGYGFTRWLALGRKLDGWGVQSAPHHYGGFYGNYATGHLAAAVDGLAFVEWDEAETPGVDTSAYVIHDGFVHIPDAPGFGLTLDEDRFEHAVGTDGYRVA
jgi:L-rhamnonate dehydratase